MAKKKQIRNVLCFLVMILILMLVMPVSAFAVSDRDNTTGVSNSLIALENTFTEKSPSSGDCAPVPDADLPEIYLKDTQESVLSIDSGTDTNITILTDISDDTRETVSALGCRVKNIIDDPCCKGYCVYVDGVYQFTEGQGKTPDGYCEFPVSAGTHTIKITKNGRSASKANYFQCGTTYRWISMPYCWCEDGDDDDCKYPPTVKFDKTKYYEGDTVHVTVSTSQSSVYYKIKDCYGTVRKSGSTSNGKKISYTIPKGASECCYWQICFYWNEYTPPWMALAGAGGEVTALSYDCTKCYNFYVCPVQTCEVYVTIEDPCCVGYKVYVDGVYQFTEGGDGTPPDGYCAFHVKEGTHTLKITKNGRSASKTIYFQCNAIYHWVRMPKNWCGDGEAYVEIKDKYCKGYEVYVDDVYQFTEGRSGTPDGNCGFFVTEGTKTIEIRKNGRSASLNKYFDCSYRYVWDSMPDYWCDPCADPPTVKFDKPKYNEGDAMFATVSTSSGSVNYKIKDCSGTVRKSGDRSNGGAIYYTIPKGTSKNCCNWQICFYWGENSPPIAAAAGADGGEVTAQSYDCTKCYEFEVCPGEKPAPEIINVTYPIMCVKEGENATISVTVENKGGMSSEGYITVSFPNDEEVSVVSGTGNGYNKLYQKGFWPLWNSKGEQMTVVDPLVELFETNWDAGEKHTLTMNVKPNSGSNTIEFLVRAALKNDADGNYERDPTSGDNDQQGWYAKKYSVDVCGGDTIPVKFIGEITGEGTPISSYQFDVRVDEILSDPSGKLEVGETASVWAHGSTFTIEAGVGDRVEVLGFYRGTIDDMDKIQLENPSHFLEEQAYRWIKTDENAKFDCGTNNEYFNVSFYSDWLATQIMIEAETGENYQSRGPVLFWLNKPPDVSDWMRVLDASKGMIELWPNKFEEAKGLKIYYRITPYSTEKDKFNRVAWISKSGFESLTGENKDFVVYILGVAYGVQIFGGSDGVHDGYITTYEGNITKDFVVGDEINLDVPSGSIRLKILELKWSPKNADWLEMVKVDYEIILDGDTDFQIGMFINPGESNVNINTELLTKLNDTGIKRIFVNTYEANDGTKKHVFYAEKNEKGLDFVVKPEKTYNLDTLLTEAHDLNIEVHAAIACFGPIAVGPSYQNQEKVELVVEYLLTNYRDNKGRCLDGIHLDYVRFVKPFRADGGDTDTIASFLEELKGKVGNRAKLSASVCAADHESPNCPSDRECWAGDYLPVTREEGQNYTNMSKNLDFISPMAYHYSKDYNHDPNYVGSVTKFVKKRVVNNCDVIPDIQVWCEGEHCKGEAPPLEEPGPNDIYNTLNSAKNNGAKGANIFRYIHLSDDEWLAIKRFLEDHSSTFS